MKSFVKKSLILTFFTLFSGLILTYQPGWFFGLIFLFFFVFYYAKDGYLLLERVFDFPQNSFLSRFFGVLTVFWLLVTVGGFLILVKIPIFYLSLLVLPVTDIVLEILVSLSQWRKKREYETEVFAQKQETVLPSSTSFLVAVLLLMVGAFYVLARHQTGEEILTPWSVLPDFYPYLYLLIYLVLGLLIFTNNHAKTLLIIFFVFSLLCHFNLSLTHKLVYGADYWRHLGTQNQILQGGGVVVQNFAENPSLIEKINFGLYSYLGFWGLNVILNLFTGFDFLTLGKFVGPILWSLFVPVLFYALGRVLSLSKRLSLFLVWLSFIPSALLTSGSFSLPATLHFVFWLFSLILLLKANLKENKSQLWGLLFVGLLLLSGYLLYAVLFFLALGLKLINTYLIKNNLINNIVWLCVSVLTGLFLPAIEIVSGYSDLSFKSDLFSAIKQFVGNLTGYYFVFGPRPHTIATGNILFNQTPDYAFVSNGLTTWSGWMLVFGLLFIGFAVYGSFQFFQKESVKRWLAVFFYSLFIGYFISRYLLNGENILARRLDIVLSTGLIIFFAYGIFYLQQYFSHRSVTVFTVIILAIFGSAIYTLGPASKVVSFQEYLDYTDIATRLRDENKYCVIADPYNLTALEGVSAKQIVGGGFPIKGDFSQPELQYILKSLQEGKDKMQIIVQAKQITGAKNCFVLEKNENGVKMIKY